MMTNTTEVLDFTNGPGNTWCTFVRTPACPHCRKQTDVAVNTDELIAWQHGTFVQEAFPHLNTGQRELLMTGFHEKCWDTVFGSEEKRD